jgi:tRNA nucleotidyltransferase (CCA-adding enzyme)
MRTLPREAAAHTLNRLSLPKDEQHEVLQALEAESKLAEVPSLAALDPVERYHRLSAYGPAVLVYLAAIATAPGTRRSLVDYWRNLRPITLGVDGKDLKAMGLPPGPRYGEILKAVMDARLSGRIHTPDEERALLTELARSPQKET